MSTIFVHILPYSKLTLFVCLFVNQRDRVYTYGLLTLSESSVWNHCFIMTMETIIEPSSRNGRAWLPVNWHMPNRRHVSPACHLLAGYNDLLAFHNNNYIYCCCYCWAGGRMNWFPPSRKQFGTAEGTPCCCVLFDLRIIVEVLHCCPLDMDCFCAGCVMLLGVAQWSRLPATAATRLNQRATFLRVSSWPRSRWALSTVRGLLWVWDSDSSNYERLCPLGWHLAIQEQFTDVSGTFRINLLPPFTRPKITRNKYQRARNKLTFRSNLRPQSLGLTVKQSKLGSSQRFIGTCCLPLQGRSVSRKQEVTWASYWLRGACLALTLESCTLLWNVGWGLQDWMTLRMLP